MFGDLMGNMEEKQAEMKKQLQGVILQETIEGITITGNAAKEITNIAIDEDFLKNEGKDAVEDLLLVAMNNLLSKMGEEEGKASQKMINDMLPPGMGGMFS